MTFTGQANASAKSKPIHPAPRLTGSATTRPRTTGAGTPSDTTSYSQSAVSFFTPATMARGVSRGPESMVRFKVCPVASSLTRVPPTSTTRIRLGDGSGMGPGDDTLRAGPPGGLHQRLQQLRVDRLGQVVVEAGRGGARAVLCLSEPGHGHQQGARPVAARA